MDIVYDHEEWSGRSESLISVANEQKGRWINVWEFKEICTIILIFSETLLWWEAEKQREGVEEDMGQEKLTSNGNESVERREICGKDKEEIITGSKSLS